MPHITGAVYSQVPPHHLRAGLLSLSFKQNRLSENLGAEHEAKSKLRWLAQAAVLSAGWRWAGPVRLPFGRPGDLPHGFGGSA